MECTDVHKYHVVDPVHGDRVGGQVSKKFYWESHEMGRSA